MSDFSNKYKSAVEEMQISPDFKERTEKMMIELRDSENAPKRSHIRLYRSLSVIAAAAACVAVAFSLNRTGVFDKDSDPAVIVTDTIETQAMETTADIPAEEAPVQEAPEADIPEAASVDEYSIASADSIPIPDFTEPVQDETTPEVTEASVAAFEAPVTTAASVVGELHDAQVSEPAKKAEPVPQPPAETRAVTQEAEPEEAVEEELELESAEYTPPAGSYTGSDIHDNEDETEDDSELSPSLPEAGEGVSGSSDDMGTALVSDFSRAESFSAKEAVSGFKAASSSAVIIPSVSGYDDENGSVTSYSSRKVRGIKDLDSLEKELYIYTEDQTASSVTAVPSDSRYIVDLADDQGNSLRIYIGSSYICFLLTDGSLFSYDLTEDEYSAIDSIIMSLIA
ncbi:unknown [Ruminococcus sp. CAG:353]|nr:unknown [Ruminococcus sp. CAG:353]